MRRGKGCRQHIGQGIGNITGGPPLFSTFLIVIFASVALMYGEYQNQHGRPNYRPALVPQELAIHAAPTCLPGMGDACLKATLAGDAMELGKAATRMAQSQESDTNKTEQKEPKNGEQ